MTNVWLPPMNASDVMTKNVVTVGPETPTRTVAKLLLENGFSAVPVIDDKGAAIGMVSESDLITSEIRSLAPRRGWWLELLAEGEDLATEFVDYLKAVDRPVREVMTAPVITVAPVEAIAEMLQARNIKRVPVVRDGRVVGIVSRADLVRALANFHKPGPAVGAR
jgi:CBS domain-containing protein